MKLLPIEAPGESTALLHFYATGSGRLVKMTMIGNVLRMDRRDKESAGEILAGGIACVTGRSSIDGPAASSGRVAGNVP